jgi:hypothetical protein
VEEFFSGLEVGNARSFADSSFMHSCLDFRTLRRSFIFSNIFLIRYELWERRRFRGEGSGG